jgi:hypothetical protein
MPKDEAWLQIPDFIIKSWGQRVRKRGETKRTYKFNEAHIWPHRGMSGYQEDEIEII